MLTVIPLIIVVKAFNLPRPIRPETIRTLPSQPYIRPWQSAPLPRPRSAAQSPGWLRPKVVIWGFLTLITAFSFVHRTNMRMSIRVRVALMRLLNATHLGDTAPLELMTRCHGTFVLLNMASSSCGKCFIQTPTCLGRCAVPSHMHQQLYHHSPSKELSSLKEEEIV